jgi:acyl-CoA dehydrogenase
MDFEFSPDTLMLRDMLRRFVEKEAKPLEMKYFSTGALEPEERARLRKVVEQMGIWGITLPEEYGGGGLDMETTCLLEEELGRTFIPVELGEVPALLYACQGKQIERFLQPALEGSRRVWLATREPTALRPEEWTTTAVLDGDTYILSGSKLLASVPRPEDFLVVFAKVATSTTTGVTAFLLDMDQGGLRVENNGRVTAWMKNCRIGLEAVLGECDQAFTLGAEEAPRTWIRLGARYVGLAERLIEMAATYAQDWVSLGEPLKARPAVQRMLAEMRAQIDCSRWLVYHAAWMADRKESLRLPSAEVRLVTGEMIRKTIDQVTMIYGGPGFLPGNGMPRMVKGILPEEAFELGLDSARVVIAEGVLAAGADR